MIKRRYAVMLGCDPEFFIEFDNKIQGSEKLIPKDNKFIKRDGVQCELNPRPMVCRAHLHNEIRGLLRQLKQEIERKGIKYEIVSDQVIKMDKKILDALSAEARRFGCAPSNNAYTKTTNKIKVSASKYLYRSAGGHIHIGFPAVDYNFEKFIRPNEEGIQRLVKLFDIMVGCIGTLLDRDIWARERRKVYGRAGDYRTPKHGFEYRTLSNFWLKDYMLMSLVFGQARTACLYDYSGYSDEAFKAVEHLDIETIINNNDMDGAIEVYNCMEPIYNKFPARDDYPLNAASTKIFREFFMDPRRKPAGEDNILEYWVGRPEGHKGGFFNTLLKRKWNRK